MNSKPKTQPNHNGVDKYKYGLKGIFNFTALQYINK